MNTERDPQYGRVLLPGFAESAASGEQVPGPDRPASARPRGRDRKVGIHQVRRMSNWTAAALIVGTGATAVALAHHAIPVATPAAVASGGITASGPAAQGTNGPQVSNAVATTSASGVTTTTTTRVVNGKTVVTQVRHGAARHDT
jgi:hypothetical protein